MVVKEKKLDKVKKPVAKTSKPKKHGRIAKLLLSIGGYLKGSWIELRQVRWPDRKSTWGMTAAVLLFTGAFVLLIVSLDAIFSQLFNLIIK